MYKCNFPSCDYITAERSQIHKHHIVPVSKGGSNKKHNLLMLCPNCHSKIFQPDSKFGIHSKKCSDSIIIEQRLFSTGGYLLEYRYPDSDELNYSSCE